MNNQEWVALMNKDVPEVGGKFKPGSYDELHPGRFLKAGHLLGEPRTLTIAAFDAEVMGMKKGQPDIKGILSFKEVKLQYASQKTNHVLLQALFGASPDALIGKRVTFGPAKDTFGRDTVAAIRVTGSPDMERESIEVTVKYAEKCGRKPSVHTLTKTKVGPEPAPPKPRGDLPTVLALLTDPVTAPSLLAGYLEKQAWTKPERAQLQAAVDALGKVKTTVDVGEEDVP